MSGLQINTNKSEIFLGGISHSDQGTIEGIPIHSLPIRYLGLPLTTRSMTSSDFAPLIDNIRTRLLNWSSKHLSYGGRLQLLTLVISSIVNFWLSVFCLPKKCLKEIESMCNAFLWSESPSETHKSKVAWEVVCTPKCEGGLGIRRLGDNSRIYIYSLIWRLLSCSKSLWSRWIRRHLIRNHTFWDTPCTSLGSWIWRKIQKQREMIKNFIKVDIGNGQKASFWYDRWFPKGTLIDILGATGPRTLGITQSAKVIDAIQGDSWRISCRARSHTEILEAIRKHPIPHPEDGEDVYFWKHGQDSFKTFFSSSKTWDQIRHRKNKVNWSKLVWFSQGIPRSSFITWLAFRNRLSTGDRMRTWGQVQACLLCGERNETRDHLFFACPYTFTLWSKVAGPLLGAIITPDWTDTITSLTSRNYGREQFILLRLALQVTIDRVWRERNERRHSGKRQTLEQLNKNIDRTVRNRLHSLRYHENPATQTIMQIWLTQRT